MATPRRSTDDLPEVDSSADTLNGEDDYSVDITGIVDHEDESPTGRHVLSCFQH
jgi:hypothetical protein